MPASAAAAADGQQQRQQLRHRVLMVSDFFYPNVGGVENHIYQLSQHLLLSGHKVVVVTHGYDDCRGVRYLSNGLKVYYLHRRPMYQQSSFPTLFGLMPLMRCVLLRERVTLVHVHGAFSTLALEAAMFARTMAYPVVFTDHSLFGFADAGSIYQNKVLKCVLADVNHCVCVSHTSRENTVLRACLPPARVSVIPNAVDARMFYPAGGHEEQQQQQQHQQQQPHDGLMASAAADGSSSRGTGDGSMDGQPNANPSPYLAPKPPPWPRDGQRDSVVVVLLSRLVYRKGLDLVALALPHLCTTHPNVDVLIGGGGPKAQLLRTVMEAHGLQQRITLEGPVPSDQAANFMRRGHIFVNASLTEAFCMAIVEAAACGLLVVSTRVGGVPEVLPPDMVELAEPSAEGLCRALEAAIKRVGTLRPHEQHCRVAHMYSWSNVVQRTVDMYTRVALAQQQALAAAGAPLGPGAHPDTLPTDIPGAHNSPGHWAGWPVPSPGTAARLMIHRLRRYVACGPIMGPLVCIYAVWLHFWWCMLCWLVPAHSIEAAADWPARGTASS